jgi:P4 family phage/plasmid primase-like protien
MHARRRGYAKNDDAKTWATFEECEAAVNARADLEGFGPVLGDLGDGRHLVGVDLDNAVDPETGAPRPWAQEVIDQIGSYTEISPSGTGYKIFALADHLPPLPSKKLVIRKAPDEHHNEQIEVFPAGRYFCLTGQHLDGTPDTLEDVTEPFARLAHLLAAAKRPQEANASTDDDDDGRPAADIDPDLPGALLVLLAKDAKLRRAWTKGAKLGRGGDTTASGLDISLTLYLSRHLDDEQLEEALRRFPFGQIGTGAKSGAAANRRISELIGIAQKAREAAQHDNTQDGIAQAFVDMHEGKVLYDHTAGAWFICDEDSRIWVRDNRKLTFSWTRSVARAAGFDGKASTAAGAEKFAQCDERVAVTHDEWNPDPFLLGTPGGAVDLRTGKMRPATPEDRITKQTAVTPKRGPCPLWMAFLDQATNGDKGLQKALKKIVGYSLTGDIREHALFFIAGSGGNGKGVFLNTVTRIAGEYATTAAMDTFTATHSDRHPTDLAMLNGARLVTASETEDGKQWAEARIKQLTGGDPITARFMRKDYFTYKPEFKLLIIGNHKPALRNVDDAMRRRLWIILFNHKPANPDKELEKKLESEWPQILAWAIDGCREWLEEGLTQPDVVKEATAEYFADQDLVGQWMGECCSLHPSVSEKGSVLFASWKAYAEERGAKAFDSKWFADVLRRCGLEKIRPPRQPGMPRTPQWKGIQLTAEAQADADEGRRNYANRRAGFEYEFAT